MAGRGAAPMQRLGLLTEILPEFARIDSLVVRDFYHRYTVDEHTLRTIEHLQELAEPPDARGAHFQTLWKSVDRRDLLILSLLLHDIGKGMPVENHVAGSLEALETVAERLQLSEEETAEVHFLIEHHLDMSATVQRRDIFDPSTISAFAASMENQERLQRLCLLTYADIHAVNPEALTPWKADMLWQLFVATSNHFSRTLDRDRLHAHEEASVAGARASACQRNWHGRDRAVPGRIPKAIPGGAFARGNCGAPGAVSEIANAAGANRSAGDRAHLLAHAAHGGSSGACSRRLRECWPAGE